MAVQFNPFEYFKENTEKDLATKADIAEINARASATELRLQKEIESVRLEIKSVELRLQKEIEGVRHEISKTEIRLLLWQGGFGVALAVSMAKGFGWIGF